MVQECAANNSDGLHGTVACEHQLALMLGNYGAKMTYLEPFSLALVA